MCWYAVCMCGLRAVFGGCELVIGGVGKESPPPIYQISTIKRVFPQKLSKDIRMALSTMNNIWIRHWFCVCGRILAKCVVHVCVFVQGSGVFLHHLRNLRGGSRISTLGHQPYFISLNFRKNSMKSKKNIWSGEILDLPLQKAVEDITGEESE